MIVRGFDRKPGDQSNDPVDLGRFGSGASGFSSSARHKVLVDNRLEVGMKIEINLFDSGS